MGADEWFSAVEEFRRRGAKEPLTLLGEVAARIESAADADTAVGRTVRRSLDRARLVRARRRGRAASGPSVGGEAQGEVDRAEVTARMRLILRDEPEDDGEYLAICVESVEYRGSDALQAKLLDAAATLGGRGWRIGFFDQLAWDLIPAAVTCVLADSGSPGWDSLPVGARLIRLGSPGDRGAKPWHADEWLTAQPSAADIVAAVTRDRLPDAAPVPAAPVPAAPVQTPAAPVAPGVRLSFYPDYRTTNPYLDMLYSAGEAVGADVLPALDPVAFEPRFLTRGARPHVLHLHWTHALVDRARTEAEAQAWALVLAENLRRFTASGGTLVWTVHNVVPHEMVHPRAQRMVLSAVAELADVIHVMCPATAAEVAHEYHLPQEKMIVVGHSSYLGYYPDTIDRAEARRRLRIRGEDRVAALVGAFRAYKGVDTLMAALDDPRVSALGVRGLIAGRPKADAATDELRRRAARHPRIDLHLGFVPEEELQAYFRAADVAVFPYRRTLNSGALMAALTFGTPVIAPAQGCLPDVVRPEFGILYNPDDAAGFADALARIDELRTDEARAAARDAARSLTPQRMSEQFFAAVFQRLRR